MSEDKDSFFIGWSADTPRADRRFLLGAAFGLIAGAGALGGALSLGRPPIGAGVWDMGTPRTLRGTLSDSPYPLLRTTEPDGQVRTIFLATSGKNVLQIDPGLVGSPVTVAGTLIERGRNAMMAVDSLAAAPDVVAPAAPPAVDRGPILLVGEILDAKCWFGAMRPGYGKTHKACAALCVRGGLPLAFCQAGSCGDGLEAPLLVDETGAAFGRAILPFVADPIALEGQLFHVGDVVQIRAALSGIRRL
jgi:hypothetical protein